MQTKEPKTIGVVVCAAGGALDSGPELVKPLLDLGYRVAVTLTPTVTSWFESEEIAELAEATGLPVRSMPRGPRERSPHPRIDCFVVAPASANYVAKLSTGVADNQALTQVSETLGTSTPIVLFPRVNAAHTRHPAWEENIARLRRADVHLIEGPDIWPLHEPRAGAPSRPLPWEYIVRTVQALVPVP